MIILLLAYSNFTNYITLHSSVLHFIHTRTLSRSISDHLTHFSRYIMTSRGFPRLVPRYVRPTFLSKNSRKLTRRENLYNTDHMCHGGVRGVASMCNARCNRCDRTWHFRKRGFVGSQAFCIPLGLIYYMLSNEEKSLRTGGKFF